MPSADGFIKSIAGGRFVATFMVDDIMFKFSGSFTSSVPAFTCITASLEYTNSNVLNATRTFEGRVGPSNVQLNVANGPKINGVLRMPLLPGSTVSGSGVWIVN